jgi:CdiI immunity protein
MSTDHSSKKSGATPISAADFPALRSFLRGYFHQDMKDEYGSPAEAVQEFSEDASGEERTAVAKDWSRFLDQTKGQSLEQINRHLTGALGSSYSLTADDLQQIIALLRDLGKSR